MGKPKGPPALLNAGGQMYQLVVFKVHTTYEDGSPEDCTLIPDEQSVEITGGEEFMTAYVPRAMLRKR